MMHRRFRPFLTPAIAVLIVTFSVAAASGPAVRFRRLVQRDYLGQHASDGHRSDPHKHASDRQGAVLATWRESVGLWDPETGAFSAAAIPSYNAFCSGHAFLADGRLMVAGGHIANYNGENRADIYNPFTNTWANVDPKCPTFRTWAQRRAYLHERQALVSECHNTRQRQCVGHVGRCRIPGRYQSAGQIYKRAQTRG